VKTCKKGAFMSEGKPITTAHHHARRFRWRTIIDGATGLIFIAPAFIIIFVFGLFPILFSVYVSLHRWRINPGDYLGLGNFVRALDSLAYVIAFWLAMLFATLAITTIRRLWNEKAGNWRVIGLWALPGLAATLGIAAALQFGVRLLPEILGIAQKVRGQIPTQELFLRLLGEAWRVDIVQSALRQMLIVLAVSIVLAYLTYLITGRRSKDFHIFSSLTLAFTLTGSAGALTWLTWTEIQAAYATALENGTELALWSQIITISAGFVLLLFSWLTWRSASDHQSNLGMILRLVAGAVLLVGAWVLIGEIPRVVQAGDRNWWQGLIVTVYYSVGTVPFQLGIALFLAVLLFQEIKGKSLFRLVYFLPYITPAVAAAAVFRVIFSSRPGAVMNSVLGFFGMKPLLWLDEPMGVFRLIGGASIPDWMAGPSLALVVIIIYNIWSYVGYDIVIFLAGLGGIPGELYEAASIDGAGKWAQFRHITFPLLSPTTYFLTLLAVIGTFKAFNHVWVLRKAAALGTTDTASIVIFTEFNRNTRYGYAAALALILFLIILALTVINNRIAEKRVFYG
jgi:ABC-type sugar transport system permease subunit